MANSASEHGFDQSRFRHMGGVWNLALEVTSTSEKDSHDTSSHFGGNSSQMACWQKHLAQKKSFADAIAKARPSADSFTAGIGN